MKPEGEHASLHQSAGVRRLERSAVRGGPGDWGYWMRGGTVIGAALGIWAISVPFLQLFFPGNVFWAGFADWFFLVLFVAFWSGMAGALIGMFSAIADERLPRVIPRILAAALIGAAFLGGLFAPFAQGALGAVYGGALGTAVALWAVPGGALPLEEAMPLRGRWLRLGCIFLLVVLFPFFFSVLEHRLGS